MLLQLLFRVSIHTTMKLYGLFSQYIFIIAKRVGLRYNLLDITLINLLQKKASVKEAFIILFVFPEIAIHKVS
jgi:hypothetical protein